MSDTDVRKPAAPLYWCGHWTSLNVHPCQSCIDEFGKQTAYYRESDFLALVAERDALLADSIGDRLGFDARLGAAEAGVARLRVSLSDARDQLQRGVPIGIEMAEKIIDAALGKEQT